MADETYEIYALRYGENANRARSGSFIFEDDHTTPHPLDYIVRLIRNERGTIMVDTGFSRATIRERGQTTALEPIEMPKLLGVSPTEITDLVISHLHYDHAGTLVADGEATYASHRRLKTLAPSVAHVIPGHDPLVRLAFPNHRGDDDSVVRVDLAADMAVLEKDWAG
ncbi:MAG: MBL fold metallo-hydrolase [Cucumibacter sp.]